MTPLLDIQHLTKRFGALELFNDISFSVAEGQKVGLIAHNGAGKTTLLSILAGREDYDDGAIVTRKDGLDTSHIGFAQWGHDNRLHLLNASQIHRQVISEPMTLYQYMAKHPSQLGIRVIEVKL